MTKAVPLIPESDHRHRVGCFRTSRHDQLALWVPVTSSPSPLFLTWLVGEA